jgi:hypothetical protein
MDLPIVPFLIKDPLELDKAGGKEDSVIGRNASEGLLEVEGISSPENEVLSAGFLVELLKEEFDEGCSDIADHIEFWSAADSSSQKKRFAHFALHHIDQGRKGRVLSDVLNLPCPGLADGSDAERGSYIFKKHPFGHSIPPNLSN